MTATLVCCKHVLYVLPQATTVSQAVTVCKTAESCVEVGGRGGRWGKEVIVSVLLTVQ